MSKKEIILKKAKQILCDSPIDAGHDLSHHERVRDLAFDIAKNCQNGVGEDLLEIAAMWHDVVIGNKESLLRQLLSESGFDHKFADSVIYAIDNHEFWDRPKSLEAKILYDADKLDALNLQRGKRIVEAIKRRDISEKRRDLYVRVGKFWLKHMRSRLHFDYSKDLFDKRIVEILENQEIEQMAKEIGIDFEKIRPLIGKGPNIFEKVIAATLQFYHGLRSSLSQ